MLLLRTLLTLGRVSNLPTVWSNCIAGWWLGGAGNLQNLAPLLTGTTLMYLAGMFLNDAFDTAFDAQHRRERPIPSGAIPERAVWYIGFSLLFGGFFWLFLPGVTTGMLGVLLAVCILLYDALHKILTVSPLLMAGCRFLLYLIAASVAVDGVTGWAAWCGLAMAAYVVGLSYLASKESTRAVVHYWPCLVLAIPVVLAMFMNTNEFRTNALLLSAILVLWIIRHLRFTFSSVEHNVGKTVSGLLAGIVLVDLLAVADITRPLAFVLLGLFLLSLLFQRLIPAT